tara:strand:- start:219 stop:509 length:291 start_codon:yes stop_codon:yes gene_type:complete
MKRIAQLITIIVFSLVSWGQCTTPEPTLSEVYEEDKRIRTSPSNPENSEAEVLENGLDLGEMQALQQQKIEELTLYIIQQQKQIDLLMETVTELTK